MLRLLHLLVLLTFAVGARAGESEDNYARLWQECWERQLADRAPGLSEAQAEAFYADLAMQLSSSEAVEEQLARAVVGQVVGDAEVEAAIERALELDPNNTLVLGFAAGKCAAKPGFSWCAGDPARRWLRVDPGNLQAHLAALAGAWSAERVDEAEDILLDAAETATGLTPGNAYAAAIANAILRHAPPGEADADTAVIAGLGFEMALPVGSTEALFALCTRSLDEHVLAACLQVARLLLTTEDRSIDVSLGLGLMKRMDRSLDTAVPDRELAEALQLHADTHRLSMKAQYLMCERDFPVSEYFRLTLRHGEIGALSKSIELLEGPRPEAVVSSRTPSPFSIGETATIGSAGTSPEGADASVPDGAVTAPTDPGRSSQGSLLWVIGLLLFLGLIAWALARGR